MQKEYSNVKKNDGRLIPFTLVKYFTFTSFLLMFVGTVSLSTFHTHLVRNIILKKSNDYAKLLVENLNHQIFLKFLIPVYIKQKKIQLRNQNQFKIMDNVIKSTLHSFEIDMVNIYDTKNIVSYSFNTEIVGEKDIGGPAYFKAIKGEITTEMLQTGSFFEMLIRYPKTAKITTFAPLRAETASGPVLDGPILGVMEIVQDVSEDYRKIFKLQLLVILTTAMVMSILFLILRQIVKNGEDIIIEKNLERLRLKEELNRVRHLSSIGEMTAIISHEIKNPLGIIRSSAEHLSKKLELIDQPNKFANIIIEESNRMNLIINDFLSFAKPRSLNLKKVNINSIIEKNLDYLKQELSKNKCIVIKNLSRDIPEMPLDSTLIYQTFLNILINSMEAMPEGGNIFIATTFVDSNIEIEFTDTGPGIPRDLIYKVKDPFFTTKSEGSGLGLGIVEQTVKKHNGQLYIDNTRKNGAKLTIRIPITPEEKVDG